MIERSMVAVAAIAAAFAVACAPQETPQVEPAQQAGQAGVQQVALQCEPSPRMPVADRASPYDSAMVAIGDAQAKVCYGRPSARGRTMIGGEAVPYGQLWRTGANEPTIIHLPVAVDIAGVQAGPGSYSLYTIPGPEEWTIIVNRSTEQWGHESQYTEQVRAQEVGRATVRSERTEEPVETFTIRAEPAAGDRADLILEWERTRVRIPVARRGA